MTIIAFCGERGSGKDTAAQALRLLNFQPLAFADPIRWIGREVFGLTDAQMTDRVLKELPVGGHGPYKDLIVRDILKTIGTECFRAHYPDVWVNALRRRSRQFGKVAITDLRFFNERDAVKAEGGIVVRIDNPNVQASTDQHQSEIEWRKFEFDEVLVNDFRTAELFQAYVRDWYIQYSKLRQTV